jgi:glutathione peroxidase
MFLRILILIIMFNFLIIEKTLAAEIKINSAYDFVFKSIDGAPMPLSKFSGKALLIVNTASFCGFTKQYTELQTLWSRYKDKGLIVLGVPSNDFGQQEPGTETEIKEFCKINFDIDFPMTAKEQVKGASAHPFYKWALNKKGAIAKPRWNFHKYLINSNGVLMDWFSSPTSPLSTRLINSVEAAIP